MKIKTHQQFKKGSIFHADMMHTDYFDYWLDNFTKDGRTLNVCCGTSDIGDVRLDIAKTIKIIINGKEVSVPTARTQYGDMFDLSEFENQEFDYVYCDSLFKFYTSGKNRMRWQFELFRLSKKALITRRPKVNINMPSTRHHYIILEDSRPSLNLVRIDWRN